MSVLLTSETCSEGECPHQRPDGQAQIARLGEVYYNWDLEVRQ